MLPSAPPWVLCTTGILPFPKIGCQAPAAGARGQAGGGWAATGSLKPFGEPCTRVERWGQSEASGGLDPCGGSGVLPPEGRELHVPAQIPTVWKSSCSTE